MSTCGVPFPEDKKDVPGADGSIIMPCAKLDATELTTIDAELRTATQERKTPGALRGFNFDFFIASILPI